MAGEIMLKQADAIPNANEAIPLGRRKTSYAEFVSGEHDGLHAEWVEGEVVPMSPITVDHNDLTRFLLHAIELWVQAYDLGMLKYEPFQMKTGPMLPGRSPDIIFISKKNPAKLHRTYLAGPADLVVEVISDGSRGVDRGDKYYEYEKGGVREYWLLDPKRQQAEFYVLGKGGVYRLASVEDSIYRSTVLKNLAIDVRWLWKKPLPSIFDLLKAWKLNR